MTVYPAGNGGNVVSIVTITDPNTLLSGPRCVTLDLQDNIFVTNSSDSAVIEYAPGSNGDVAPMASAITGIAGAYGIATTP